MNDIMLINHKKSLLTEWLDYIQSFSPIPVHLNLDRVRAVAIALHLLPFNIFTILVGGTNGKGTTCCLLENVLLKNNIKVGLYTSPHLLFYNERIRVCGQKLSDDIHIKSMSVIEKARNNIALTYFEFTTLSALYIFKQFQLDLVILEVGLGGRLDATNIVDPDISVITNIAIDHTDLLGTTRNQIAIEKSGIFRSYKPTIIGEINYPTIINEIAKYYRTILSVRGQNWNFYCYKNKWIWFDCNNYRRFLINLPLPIIPLENAAVVLSVLYWLPFPISKLSICYGLKKAALLGRFQIINYKPLIILDVGHNSHAASYVTAKLSSMISNVGTVRIVIGMLKNKDIKSTIYCLSNVINVWYCANLNTPLSASTQQLFNCCINFNAKYFDNIVNAWKQAILDSSANDCILVFGSFYAVNPIMKLIISNNQYNKLRNIY